MKIGKNLFFILFKAIYTPGLDNQFLKKTSIILISVFKILVFEMLTIVNTFVQACFMLQEFMVLM